MNIALSVDSEHRTDSVRMNIVLSVVLARDFQTQHSLERRMLVDVSSLLDFTVA